MVGGAARGAATLFLIQANLMVELLLARDRRRLRTKGVVLSVYDPRCGAGGVLTVAKEHVTAGGRATASSASRP